MTSAFQRNYPRSAHCRGGWLTLLVEPRIPAERGLQSRSEPRELLRWYGGSQTDHVKINDVIQNLDPKIFKSKNQFIIDAIQFYIDNYGKETFVIKKKEKERAEYIRSEDIEDIKEEVIEVATNEARKEVIRLLGGVISGMNVGQPVIMQAANSEAQEPTEDVMDDADVVQCVSLYFHILLQ